jgi:hypothetical protein
MTNVFFVSPDLGPVDRLTAYWRWVLEAVPGVGQAFVDHVSSCSGLAPSTFLGSVDHPMGDRVNRLDLLISCQDYDVLFEHKLDSPLGRGQLERYLTFCLREVNSSRSSPPVLCHSQHPSAIPCGLSALVRPARQRMFCGKTCTTSSAVFPIASPATLRSFSTHGGLRTSIGPAVEIPLCRTQRRERCVRCTMRSPPCVAAPGVSCLTTPNSLIYQIRRPFPPVHLINVGPLVSVAE